MSENKLCLGTVQLGMEYGINNALSRQPTEKESFAILQTAIDEGIACFDTASAYGSAEEILGRFAIKKFPVKVISKLRANVRPEGASVVAEIQMSLNRIGLTKLYGYMLHRAEDFYLPGMLHGLQLAKEKGLIERIGVSVYEPQDALAAVKAPAVDMIQIPYNVLDQRLDQTDFFELARKNQVDVFARSAFLQGLLLMDLERIPPKVAAARPYIERFREIIAPYGFTPLEAALLYSYSHSGISYVVFGADTVRQIRDNVKLVEKKEMFTECYQALRGKFSDVPREIVVPSLWG